MALQGYGTELGIAAVTMIVIKDVIAPLIKRIPIFNNGKPKGLEEKVDKLSKEVHNPEMIPGKSESCRDHDRAIVRVETTLKEGTKRLEEKLDTAISLIRNGGKDK